MAKPTIGHINCPTCEFPDAHVRETVKGKVYIVCDECGYQAFARGVLSNERIRSKMRAAAPVELPPEIPVPKKKAAPKVQQKTAEPETNQGGFGSWLGL